MWSEVLKAVEALIKYLGNEGLDKRRRRGLAKGLVQIYLDVDRLIRRGDRILASVKGLDAGQLTLTDLIEQLKSLQSLMDSLNEPTVRAVLKIELPSVARLEYYWLDLKWAFLNDLTVARVAIDLASLSDSRQDPLSVPRDPDLVLIQKTPPESKSLDSKWKKDSVTLQQLLLSMSATDAGRQMPIMVQASPEDVESSERVLRSISGLGEELRKYIREHFEIHDILASA